MVNPQTDRGRALAVKCCQTIQPAPEALQQLAKRFIQAETAEPLAVNVGMHDLWSQRGASYS